MDRGSSRAARGGEGLGTDLPLPFGRHLPPRQRWRSSCSTTLTVPPRAPSGPSTPKRCHNQWPRSTSSAYQIVDTCEYPVALTLSNEKPPEWEHSSAETLEVT